MFLALQVGTFRENRARFHSPVKVKRAVNLMKSRFISDGFPESNYPNKSNILPDESQVSVHGQILICRRTKGVKNNQSSYVLVSEDIKARRYTESPWVWKWNDKKFLIKIK